MTTDTQARTQTAALAILAAVALGAALYWLRSVLVPFALAIFIAYALSPLVALLHRRLRVPRIVALLLAFFLTLVLLAGVGVLVSTSIAQVAQNAESYREQIVETWDRLLLFVEEHSPFDVAAQLEDEVLEQRVNAQVAAVTRGLVSALNEVLSQGILVLLFVLFLLLGSSSQQPVTGIWAEVRDSSQRYIVTKLATSSATGVLTGLILASLGVQPALTFGLLAFLLNFIPSLGSMVATLLPLPIILIDPTITPLTGVAAIALPGIVQFSIGNLVEPRVMGASLDLHPVTVILALVFWGTLWGLVGALLAAPIAAVARLVLQRIEVTRPIADLMAGRLNARVAPPPDP